MLDDKIKKLADEKGLTIDEGNNGFSVKKDGNQIRFCFDEAKLVEFLEVFNEGKFKNDFESKNKPKIKNSHSQSDRVITNTVLEVKEVVITDIRMPFGSMVSFMVKWTIASIPALIILMVLFSFVFVLFGGILGGMIG